MPYCMHRNIFYANHYGSSQLYKAVVTFSPSSRPRAFKNYAIRKEASRSVPSCFLCVLRSKHEVSSSNRLLISSLVSNQEQLLLVAFTLYSLDVLRGPLPSSQLNTTWVLYSQECLALVCFVSCQLLST